MRTINLLNKRGAMPVMLILATLVSLLFWRGGRAVRAEPISYHVIRTPPEVGTLERVLNDQARGGLKFVAEGKIGPNDPGDLVLIFSSQ